MRNGLSASTAMSLILAATSLAGCASDLKIPDPKTVSRQDKAGVVLVSPVMVAPWSDVAANLAPGFTMNAATALGQVLPTTEQISQQTLNATSIAAGIGLPQSSSSSSGSSQNQSSNGSNGATSAAGATTTTTTTTSSSTTQSQQSSTTSPGANVPAPSTSLPTTLPSATAAVNFGVDPILKYKEAAYLNQEVALLNAEVNDIAQRSCYVPYVVKLKIAFMPYTNPLAYSAHLRIAFLPDPEILSSIVHISVDATKQQYEPTPASAAASKAALNVTIPEGCGGPSANPVVIPFLVADDVQLANYSNTMEVARQIAIAAEAVVHGVNLNANGNHLYEALTAIQNEEMHSTLTVSRSNANTLYALISPNNEATGRPNLVGQTYDVSTLLLVPRELIPDDKKFALIGVSTYTEFRDALHNGAVLAPASSESLDNRIIEMIWPFVSDMDRSALKIIRAADRHSDSITSSVIHDRFREFRSQLQYYVSRGDFIGFSRLFSPHSNCQSDRINTTGLLQQAENVTEDAPFICLLPHESEEIWGQAAALASDSRYQVSTIQTPVPRPAELPDPAQRVSLADDGSGTSTVVLHGVAGADASDLFAYLTIAQKAAASNPTTTSPPKKSKKRPKPAAQPAAPSLVPATPPAALQLTAQSLALDPVAHTLTLTFPSPSKATATGIDGGAKGNAIKIYRMKCDNTRAICSATLASTTGSTLVQNVPVQSFSQTSTTPHLGFQLEGVGTALLFDKTGSASVPLMFDSIDANVTVNLSVTGAAVTSLSPSLATAAGGPPAVTTDAKKGGYDITGKGLYLLNLQNVANGAMVTLKVQGQASAPPPAAQPSTPPAGNQSIPLIALPQPQAEPGTRIG